MRHLLRRTQHGDSRRSVRQWPIVDVASCGSEGAQRLSVPGLFAGMAQPTIMDTEASGACAGTCEAALVTESGDWAVWSATRSCANVPLASRRPLRHRPWTVERTLRIPLPWHRPSSDDVRSQVWSASAVATLRQLHRTPLSSRAPRAARFSRPRGDRLMRKASKKVSCGERDDAG